MRNPRKLRWLTIPAVVLAVGALTACGPGPTTTTPSTSTTSSPGTTPASEQPLPSELRDAEVNQAGGDSAFQSNVTQQLTSDQVYTYLVDVVTSADKMWSAYAANLPNGYTPDFYYEIVTAEKPISSNCVNGPVTSTYNNAFFCDKDSSTIDGITYYGSVVLPLDTFKKMWNGDVFKRQSKRSGDFGAAAIVAHEVAHSNWWDLSAQYKLPLINQPGRPRDKRNELIADCGAGVWSNTAYYQGYLEGTDVEEAVAALEAIGDSSRGGSDPHGSSAERGAAFMTGYNSGKPADCIKAYWPGVQGG
ncbi:neutral zinc metallopeptidase [Amycolatopsis sp. NPDC051128]|uniref:neutral zinc metallopeptidase n=1 Tax=Amycolatopsis sp. NPDC051128 TaxID=3155412 RepID=UPI00342EB5C2